MWRGCLVSLPQAASGYIESQHFPPSIASVRGVTTRPHPHTPRLIPQGHWCPAAIRVSGVAAGALYGGLAHPEQDLLRCVRRGGAAGITQALLPCLVF